jgi:hypothetical protein
MNNLYFGGMRAGITVANVDGGYVSRNSVLAAPQVALEPGVSLRGSVNMKLERTMTPVLNLDGAQAQQAGIVMLQWSKNPRGVPASEQVIGSLAQERPAITDFIVAPGSAAGQAGAGFTPVSEIGDVPDAQRDSRLAWYRLNMARLTTVADVSRESDQLVELASADSGPAE